MSEDNEVVPVLFKIGRDKAEAAYGVTAVFPTVAEGGGTVSCYAHVGQHSAASPAWAKDRKLRPATPEEYAPLKREPEAQPYGYRLKVVSRWPSRRAKEREGV